MNKRKLLAAGFSLVTGILSAQITDPMITNWWFNKTNNTYKGILTDVEAVYYTAQYVYVKSSGIPNYYRDGQSVNNGIDRDATWQIPRVPQPATTHNSVMGGPIGLMMDGSVFFHPGDARSYNNTGAWNQLAYYFEGNDMDSSNGHSTPDNMYHHHFDNLKLHKWDSVHSPIVGYAWDGYPVYGPFGYANTDGSGGIKRMASGYSTKNYTTRTNGPAVGGQFQIGCYIEDWEYVQGAGDLDQYNGRQCKTPEYPNGTYAYFTAVDANYDPAYPYFIGPTFYGSFTNTNVGPNGGKATVPGGATLYSDSATAINDIAAITSNIDLFPIPVLTVLNIRVKEARTYQVTVYDIKGSILQSRSIRGSDTIDMSHLPYGVYFIGIDDTETASGMMKRIVKQ